MARDREYEKQVRAYTRFIVQNGKAIGGWEYPEDAKDELRAMKEEGRLGDAKIVARASLAKYGINPATPFAMASAAPSSLLEDAQDLWVRTQPLEGVASEGQPDFTLSGLRKRVRILEAGIKEMSRYAKAGVAPAAGWADDWKRELPEVKGRLVRFERRAQLAKAHSAHLAEQLHALVYIVYQGKIGRVVESRSIAEDIARSDYKGVTRLVSRDGLRGLGLDPDRPSDWTSATRWSRASAARHESGGNPRTKKHPLDAAAVQCIERAAAKTVPSRKRAPFTPAQRSKRRLAPLDAGLKARVDALVGRGKK